MTKKDSRIQHQSLQIRYRENSRDVVFTPEALAANLIPLVPVLPGDTLLDPCKGEGVFLHNFPAGHAVDWCEVTQDKNFFEHQKPADWLISNPPYSVLNDWLEHSCKIARKGFAYLVGSYSITPKRLEIMEKYGFRLRSMHYLKVQQWFGVSVFVVFHKDYLGGVVVTYDRTIWKGSTRIVNSATQKTLLEVQS